MGNNEDDDNDGGGGGSGGDNVDEQNRSRTKITAWKKQNNSDWTMLKWKVD